MENNFEKANERYYKKLTIEDIEKVLSELPDNPFEYPKYHGDGIYEISKGCFTGRKGLDEFNKTLKELINECTK